MISEALVGQIARGLRDSVFDGWEDAADGRYLRIPGVGYAHVGAGRSTICVLDGKGHLLEFGVTDVLWTYGVTVKTDVPGLSIKISPTSAREGR